MFFEVHSPGIVWPYTQRGYVLKIDVNYNNNLTDPLIGGIGFPGDHISLWFDGPQMTGASYSQFEIGNDNASGVETGANANGWVARATMVISDITEAEDPQFTFTADNTYGTLGLSWKHNCWGDWPAGNSSNVGATDVLAWYTTAD